MPRIRDFNGISDKGFDGRGNYTMGIKEQIAFPEISIDKISNITGMDITFVTSTDSNTDALALLKELGLPFKEDNPAEKARDEKISNEREEEIKAAKQEVDDNNKDSSDESDIAVKEDNEGDEKVAVKNFEDEESNENLSEESENLES